MTEKEIEKQILGWLNLQAGVFAFKVNTVGVFDPTQKVYRKTSKYVVKGTSDILAIAHGRFLAIEVKTPKTIRSFFSSKKEREVNQRRFLDEINQKGGVGMVTCSLDTVMKVLNIIKDNSGTAINIVGPDGKLVC